VLELWVPPAFAEEGDESLLLTRIRDFESANPGRQVNLRVKAAEDLFRTLLAASVAAPASLPDLVILDPADLQDSVDAGLLAPLNNWMAAPSEPEWYGFALHSANIEQAFFSLPFAGDAEVLVYASSTYPSPPNSWSDLVNQPFAFLFPASDPAASFTIAQYLALGGELQDGSMLDPVVLSDVLSFFFSAQATGLLSVSARQHDSLASTWNAFQSEVVQVATSSLNLYFTQGDPETSAAIPYPTRSGDGISLTHTWSWAMLTSDPDRQEGVVELLNWLMDPHFLGPWTHALGLLPATSSALALWPDGPQSAIANNLVASAQERPSMQVLSRIGPPIRDAIEMVLSGTVSPDAAAQAAAERVQNP
jgi:ABC-type glycerol-3-phosphate transport system substrate-binding protein